MSEILFRRLTLEGFGPFREPVQLDLARGMNNIVARNESGKSSVVEGLIAVLYGLPDLSDPTRRGTARFRNWDAPRRFRGCLHLSIDDRRLVLERDFSTHRIDLREVDEDDERQLVTGTHNPRAQRRNVRYEEWMQKNLGVRRRSAYEASLCVRQPLPEQQQVGPAVQQQLTGGGVATRAVLQRLEEELKTVTRRTADCGVTSRNQIKDRRLEEVEEEMEELRREIEAGRDAIDALEGVKSRAAVVSSDFREARRELRQKRTTRANWAEWRRLRDSYRSRLMRQQRLREVRQEVSGLQEEISSLDRQLEHEYPGMDQVPADAAGRLDALVTLDDRWRGVRRDLRRTRDQLDRIREELGHWECEAAGHLPWEELFREPAERVLALRDRAERLLREWEEFARKRERVRQLDRVLCRDYAVFDEAGERALEAAAGYQRQLAELRMTEQEAEVQLTRAREAHDDLTGRWEDWEERFSDLREYCAGALQSAQHKLRLLEQREELAESRRHLQNRLRPQPLLRAGVPVVFAAAAALPALMWPDYAATLLALVPVAAVGGYLLAQRLPVFVQPQLRERVEEVESELAGVREELADLSELPGDRSELISLRERLGAREEERERLRERARSLPDEEELASLHRSYERARGAREEFCELTRPFRGEFADVQAAYAEWCRLREERGRLVGHLEDFAHAHSACEPDELESIDPLSAQDSRWRDLAEFARFLSADEGSGRIMDLVCWLRDLEPACWRSWIDDARRRSEILRNISDLHSRMQAARETLDQCCGAAEWVWARQVELMRGLQKIVRAGGGDARAARDRLREYEQLRDRRDTLSDRLTTRLDEFGAADVRGLDERLADAENRSRATFSEWMQFIDQNPGLPAAEESEDDEAVGRRLAALDDEVDRLERDVAELDEKRSELAQRQSALEGRDPVNIARAERRMQHLQEERDRLILLADALSVAYGEMREAARQFHHSIREHLAGRAAAHFARITGKEHRSIVLDEEFTVGVQRAGAPHVLQQLSRGARDQLYLALRFAMADLLADDRRLPMVLDDPFVTCDRDRKRAVRRVLLREAERRQIILLAHEPGYADWGSPSVIRPVEREGEH